MASLSHRPCKNLLARTIRNHSRQNNLTDALFPNLRAMVLPHSSPDKDARNHVEGWTLPFLKIEGEACHDK